MSLTNLLNSYTNVTLLVFTTGIRGPLFRDPLRIVYAKKVTGYVGIIRSIIVKQKNLGNYRGITERKSL